MNHENNLRKCQELIQNSGAVDVWNEVDKLRFDRDLRNSKSVNYSTMKP
jgi:hypothetical protein